ncbi:DUF924 family protein [Marinicauda sp. Alg238-R41]|uniref:DUF924 family protein n=1 Tax=Marinicauda sp. Alg238-R41 TaxID=2993447 RepID=UPI0022E79BFB|nr:DUF924 family protein [Marinicauda sp. Alg238-R41]
MRVGPDDILDFWFSDRARARWFASDAAFDASVRRLFAPLCFDLDRAPSVDGHPWLDGPEGALALIVACDQFPRNVWRGTPMAFALDTKARAAALHSLDSGFDWVFENEARSLFYMPFMHAESMEAQNLCVALCETRLGEEVSTTRHARAHRDLIARFGRFPHRNPILGRESTPEESEFLRSGGYAPGAKRQAKTSS